MNIPELIITPSNRQDKGEKMDNLTPIAGMEDNLTVIANQDTCKIPIPNRTRKLSYVEGLILNHPGSSSDPIDIPKRPISTFY